MNTLQMLKKLILTSVFLVSDVFAEPSIAVLNVELLDETLLPNTPTELQRTGGMAALLEHHLNMLGGYSIVHVAAAAQQAANPGVSYLFNNPDLSAKLAAKFGADWVVVAQHHKSSFLYSDLWVYLINVKQHDVVWRYLIELKGNSHKVTERSMKALAEKIAARLTVAGETQRNKRRG